MGSTGEFIGRRVGRFTITSHLASGGMAELFIARQEAVGGFEKDLVLKMLQERYARNQRVVEMFLDEARLAAKLNHQNIVHVYDVDESEGIRYIAMEYIHGETVTDIIRRSIAKGAFLPLEHAIHIVAETAAGLAYAHERRDPEGRPARIVHRDVSPSNILVTYEGLTKIVDFGIARVQDQIREESGMRPGKVSYMSPEQVRGEGADHRSDIFSLGIILYEITVGRRLWRGPSEVVMRRIVEEQIPPPTYVRRDYPPALELIVMKALERRPADRHQSAAELQHELNEFMEEAGLKSGSRRLSQYMKDLFTADAGASAEGNRGVEMGSARDVAADDSEIDLDEPEELDFDRRAPLMMRVEARSDEDAAHHRGHAPVPPLGAAEAGQGSAAGGSRNARQTPASGLGQNHVQNRDDPFPPLPASVLGQAGGRATRDVPRVSSKPILAAGTPAKASLAVSPPARQGGDKTGGETARETEGSTNGTAGIGGAAAGVPSSNQNADGGGKGGALRWVILLLLAGAVVVVFLGTR